MPVIRNALAAALLISGLQIAQPALAKGEEAASPIVNEDFGIPVFPYDITDRPYEVLGEVKAGVRKATIFSKAPSQEKIYKELWERAQKLGADAVVKANYGDPHVTAFSWGSVSATGLAVKFKEVSETPEPDQSDAVQEPTPSSQNEEAPSTEAMQSEVDEGAEAEAVQPDETSEQLQSEE